MANRRVPRKERTMRTPDRRERQRKIREAQRKFNTRCYAQNPTPEKIYEVGDMVLVRETETRREDFALKWVGPIPIERKYSNEVYGLTKGGRYIKVHVDRIREAPTGNPEIEDTEESDLDDPDEEADTTTTEDSDSDVGTGVDEPGNAEQRRPTRGRDNRKNGQVRESQADAVEIHTPKQQATTSTAVDRSDVQRRNSAANRIKSGTKPASAPAAATNETVSETESTTKTVAARHPSTAANIIADRRRATESTAKTTGKHGAGEPSRQSNTRPTTSDFARGPTKGLKSTSKTDVAIDNVLERTIKRVDRTGKSESAIKVKDCGNRKRDKIDKDNFNGKCNKTQKARDNRKCREIKGLRTQIRNGNENRHRGKKNIVYTKTWKKNMARNQQQDGKKIIKK